MPQGHFGWDVTPKLEQRHHHHHSPRQLLRAFDGEPVHQRQVPQKPWRSLGQPAMWERSTRPLVLRNHAQVQNQRLETSLPPQRMACEAGRMISLATRLSQLQLHAQPFRKNLHVLPKELGTTQLSSTCRLASPGTPVVSARTPDPLGESCSSPPPAAFVPHAGTAANLHQHPAMLPLPEVTFDLARRDLASSSPGPVFDGPLVAAAFAILSPTPRRQPHGSTAPGPFQVAFLLVAASRYTAKH
mmetsp:Transcript_133/g.328  ORF Transcript_133/g.328 Transcript_133/m.328 type:complete len:244 (-) Transcript_133:34-765(-)